MIKKILFKLVFYIMILAITIAPIAIIRININADILPNLELYVVYFLALYHNRSIFQIFIYGFFVDQIYGSLTGLHSSLFMISYILLSKTKTILLSKQPISHFIGFGLFTLIFGMSKYVILVYIFGYYASLLKIIIQISTTIFLYPMAYFLLSKILQIQEKYVK